MTKDTKMGPNFQADRNARKGDEMGTTLGSFFHTVLKRGRNRDETGIKLPPGHTPTAAQVRRT